MIGLVMCIRLTSKSFRTVFTVFAICGVYFVNYILLYLVSPFYYEDTSYQQMNAEFVPLLEQGRDDKKNASDMFQGIYKNFNAEWFDDIGTQVLTSYKITVFMPIIEFFLLFAWRYIFRVYD